MTTAFALVIGLLRGGRPARLGFLASFISEPVLKGFIIGLALTIIFGQVPALLGIEKQRRGTSSRSSGASSASLGDTDWLTVVLGVRRWRWCWCSSAWLPLVRARSSWCCSASPLCALFGLDDQGVDDRRPIEPGLPSLRPPDGRLDRLPRPGRPGASACC